MAIGDLREGDTVVATRELSTSVGKGSPGKVRRVNGDGTVNVRFDNGVEREGVAVRHLAKTR